VKKYVDGLEPHWGIVFLSLLICNTHSVTPQHIYTYKQFSAETEFSHSLTKLSFNNHFAANMSDLKATVDETPQGFHVEGYEKIEYDFSFTDNIFDVKKTELADCYQRWGRCLAVMDMNIFNLYGEQMQTYFDHHNIDLDIHKTMIGEKAKSMDTLLSIVDSMTKFGIYRKVCHVIH